MEIPKDALAGVAKEIAKSIRPGATLGLGSGSTVAALLQELSPLLVGKAKAVRGVPTSTQIELVASMSGFNIVPFRGSVDMVIDGADQVDEQLNLVKGGGGALLREKVVMGSADIIVVVASEDKFARRLCENGVKVPVEVFPMARESAKAKLSDLGGVPDQRLLPKGYPFYTENGNIILDTKFEPVDKPRDLEVKVRSTPGVAEVGIFTIKPITAYRLKSDGTFKVLKNSN
ncbi:MAG TPA: ribose 5-phosphate isomerase A [Nitrososphaerales archaeon]|nr:ribose 5-phosphate isomerase A [Nitrososphaerales archaeon]